MRVGKRLSWAFRGASVLVVSLALPTLTAAQAPGPITVPFSDLQAQSLGAGECVWDPVTARVEATFNPDVCCLVAPVYLPHGADLKFFFLYYYDASTTSNFSVSLRRKELGTLAASQPVATIAPTGAPGDGALITGVAESVRTVDNLVYSYFLSTDTCLVDGNHALYSATFTFFD